MPPPSSSLPPAVSAPQPPVSPVPPVSPELEARYRQDGQWVELIELYLQALESAELPRQRSGLLRRVAEVFRNGLEDDAQAFDALVEAIRADPTDPEVMPALEAQASKTQRWQEVQQALSTMVEEATDAPARVQALLHLAAVQEQHFLRPQLAAPLLESVLEMDPTHAAATAGLERCYRAMRAWGDLVHVLRMRAERAQNLEEECDSYMRMAEVLESKLQDEDAAFEAYRRACHASDRDTRPVIELARLSERASDWVSAAAYRERLAALADDPRTKAQIHVAIGEMLAPLERNPARAREHFERAVVYDPTNGAAWQSLQDLAARRGDAQAAAFSLEKRASNTEGPRRKAQLYVELATMKETAGDLAGARAAYEAAIMADVTNEPAAHAMLTHYLERSRWAEASPLCDVLVNAATRDGDADSAFGFLRLATRIASELGNGERAMTAALGALRWRATDPEALEELVVCCHAFRDQHKTLVRARDALARIASQSHLLTPASVAKLGDLQRMLGDEPAAVETYLGAIERNESDPIALAGLADAFAARGQWRDACACKERLAHATSDPDEKQSLMLVAADAWLEQARDPDMAAQAYEWAHTWRPLDRAVLHSLLAVYTKRERWHDVARTLRSLADLETERTDLKAKTVYAMAQVVREKIGDGAHAAALFEEALDLEGSRLEAFERIVRIHTEEKDWEALASAYLRMIERAGGHAAPELLFQLFHQLGLVCRDRLGDAPGALAAFCRARAIKPDDDQCRRIVTELYVVTDQLDKAVEETRASLRRDPLSPAAYHELYGLLLRQHAHDKAWCVADVLADLGAGNAEHARFLADYPARPLASVPGRLRPTAWSTHLSHRGLDTTLSSILVRMIPAVVRARLQAMSATDRQAVLGAPIDVPRTAIEHAVLSGLHHASEILGHPVPAVSRKAGPVPLAVGLSLTPAIVLSPDAAAALAPATLAFFLGKRLAEQRPALLGRAFFPSATELTTIVQTAIRLTQGPSQRASSSDTDGLAAKFDALILSGLSEDDQVALRQAVSLLLARGAAGDTAKWSQTADLTTTRAGLLLCGSVVVAHRAMLLEHHYASDLSPKARLKELLLFAVSDTYSELRGALGIAVGSKAQA